MKDKTEKVSKYFEESALTPHAYFFFCNMLLTLLFANADVNSRIASSCPYYFWTVVAVWKHKNGETFISDYSKLHNIVHMLLNYSLFLMEIAFL